MKDSLNTLGASNHSKKERSILDYYGTNPETVNDLLSVENFSDKIYEPCAGHNNIVNVLRDAGHEVIASDIFDYGYDNKIADFMQQTEMLDGDLITNPPYGEAEAFVIKALSLTKPGNKVAMLLRLQFLEGRSRYKNIFEKNPPKNIYVYTKRQVCSKTDDFTEGSAVAYAWFVWEKGWFGQPKINWITR